MAGDELIGGQLVRIGGKTIFLPDSVPGLAEYATVSRAEQEAERMRPRLVQNLDGHGQFLSQRDERLVFDFLERAKTVVVMASTGLEAFASHHITRVLGDEPTLNGDNPLEMSLDQRYSRVLPEILDTARPTKLRWWNDLRRAQALAAQVRHALYRELQRNGLSERRPLHERLYRGEYRRTAEMMVSAFEHFAPGWVPKGITDQLARPRPQRP